MCAGCDGDCAFYARQDALEIAEEAREHGKAEVATMQDAESVARIAMTVARHGEFFDAKSVYRRDAYPHMQYFVTHSEV